MKQLTDNDIIEVSVNTLLNKPDVPKSRILFVDLNDARDDEDRNDMLRRHGKTTYSAGVHIYYYNIFHIYYNNIFFNLF